MQLAEAIRLEDTPTYEHCLRTAKYAAAYAQFVGMTDDKIRYLYQGMLLHDIGKIKIPQNILYKTGYLSPEEYAAIHRHPVLGLDEVSVFRLPKDISDIILYHHERWNGTGYPDGLKGEEIPLPARIAAVTDSYDAITSRRPYRRTLTYEEGLAELERGAGTQFAPDVVANFIAAFTMERSMDCAEYLYQQRHSTNR
jgi:putative nucleotidyltransferase with HDIG domain